MLPTVTKFSFWTSSTHLILILQRFSQLKHGIRNCNPVFQIGQFFAFHSKSKQKNKQYSVVLIRLMLWYIQARRCAAYFIRNMNEFEIPFFDAKRQRMKWIVISLDWTLFWNCIISCVRHLAQWMQPMHACAMIIFGFSNVWAAVRVH